MFKPKVGDFLKKHKNPNILYLVLEVEETSTGPMVDLLGSDGRTSYMAYVPNLFHEWTIEKWERGEVA